MKLEEELQKAGLSKSRAHVYLSALQVGSGSAQEIARKAGLPRTTTHEIVQQLVGDGLVSFVAKGRARTYTVESPMRVLALIRERERDLAKAMPELLSVYNTEGTRPKVKFYDGIRGVKAVFDDTLYVHSKKLRAIISMADLYDIPGRGYMDDYIRRRVDEGIKLEVIRSLSKETEETWPTSRRERRELRYAPAGLVFPMSVYVYDNKVGIVGTEKENFGMIIESPELHQTLDNLFSVLWKVSKPTPEIV